RYELKSTEGLGRGTAEMHLALARGTEPAFAPEPLDRSALSAMVDEMSHHAAETLDLLARRRDTLPSPVAADAEALLTDRDAVVSTFTALRQLDNAGVKIRVHGDYHLGQLLRAEEDFVILDFEGEPARPIAERRAKHSPLKDLAGMIRSFSYAAYAALFAFTHHAPRDYAALEEWADLWREQVSHAFVDSYLATIGARASDLPAAAGALIPAPESWTRLLRAFVLDKALYELSYELNHRPDWIRIPLTGVTRLIV